MRDIINRNKRYYLINCCNLIIQTFIIYNLPEITNGLASIIYLLYVFSIFLTCPITRSLYICYINVNILFCIYYIYTWIQTNIYVSSLWYIIIYNSTNIYYIHKKQLFIVRNIDQIEVINYNTGDIMLSNEARALVAPYKEYEI